MRKQIVHCDVCQGTGEDMRAIFGVDVCSACFAARAGEALDLLWSRSKVQPGIAQATGLANQWNPQAR